MLASCSERSSNGRPGAIDPIRSACCWPRALRAVIDPMKLMAAKSPLRPSDTAKTTTISQPSNRLVSGGRPPSCPGITPGLYRADTAARPAGTSGVRPGASGAGGGDDRVGHETERQAEQDPPRDQFFQPAGTRDGEELDHDVQDGARGQAEEGDGQHGRGHLYAVGVAHESGAPADDPEQRRRPQGVPSPG